MSGGSYNYLYREADIDGELVNRRHDITEMAERLEKSGYYAAARSTRDVLRLIEATGRAAEALRDTWKAVEWADSGDSSEGAVRDAVAEFRPWPPPPATTEASDAR